MLPLSGSLHCSAILSFVQVDVSRFRSFGDAYEGSVLPVYVKALYSYVHTYLLGFVFRTNPCGIPASIDSSARNLAENHSGIVRKIRARPRGYPRPPAPENRGIRRKNVSYPCQVPYVAVLIMDLSDIGFCVFSVGNICVGLMFWIRVVVAFLMFCLLPL